MEHDGHNERQGVLVLGTLNPEEARPLAAESAAFWFGKDGCELTRPVSGWWRDGFTYAGRSWVEDEERGAPGVMFTWDWVDAGTWTQEELDGARQRAAEMAASLRIFDRTEGEEND